MKNEKNLIKELNKIGIMLAAERDISKLLKIVTIITIQWVRFFMKRRKKR